MPNKKYPPGSAKVAAKEPMVKEAKARPYGRPSRAVLARLRELERTQKGQIAAIEMGSQEIFIGKDVVEATLKGWKKYPGQAFYFMRIGYPAVHRYRGGLRKR